MKSLSIWIGERQCKLFPDLPMHSGRIILHVCLTISRNLASSLYTATFVSCKMWNTGVSSCERLLYFKLSVLRVYCTDPQCVFIQVQLSVPKWALLSCSVCLWRSLLFVATVNLSELNDDDNDDGGGGDELLRCFYPLFSPRQYGKHFVIFDAFWVRWSGNHITLMLSVTTSTGMQFHQCCRPTVQCIANSPMRM